MTQLFSVLGAQIPSVANFAALRSFSTTSVGWVNVLSSKSLGDRGGNLFFWDTSSVAADDGGSIAAVGGIPTGRWRALVDEFSVCDFGAVGDGVTDDSAAISAAFAAKELLPNGAIINVPPGLYKVTGPFEVGLKPFWLRGHGWNIPDTSGFGAQSGYTVHTPLRGSYFVTTSTTQDLFVAIIPWNFDYANAYRGHRFSDLAMLGPGAGATAGLRYTSLIANHCSMDNVGIFNFSLGFDPGALEESHFRYLHFIGCQVGMRIGPIAYDGVTSPTALQFFHVLCDLCGIGVNVLQGATTDILGLLLQSCTDVGLQLIVASTMEISIAHCEANVNGGVRIAPPAGSAVQHINLHGLRAADVGDGLVFPAAPGGVFAFSSVHDIDHRGVNGDFNFPGWANDIVVYNFQSHTFNVNALNGSANMSILAHGKRYFGSADANGLRFETSGAGSPEGVVAGPVGCVYYRTDGGAGTTLYVKESGTGNTGWVGK